MIAHLGMRAWWTHHGTESHRGTAREASKPEGRRRAVDNRQVTYHPPPKPPQRNVQRTTHYGEGSVEPKEHPHQKGMEATWLTKRYGRDMDASENGSMLSQVIIALKDSVDSFTQHVAKDIIKRQSLAAKLENIAKTEMSRYIISVCY